MLLLELQNNPAREFEVSSQGDIFVTYIQYGRKSYITGIWDQKIAGSKKIKSKDTAYNYAIVWSDRIGITQVDFVHLGALTPEPKVKCSEGREEDCMLNNWMRADSRSCRNCLKMDRSAKNTLDIHSTR